MNEIEEAEVVFFKRGKRNYFKYRGKISEIRPWTINHLKESLCLPYTVEFIGYSPLSLNSIISYLYDKGIDIKESNYNNDQHYIYNFLEKKNTVDAIRIPYIGNIYERKNNISPYTIIELNDKKLLIEVTKDYAKLHDGVYYFLLSDLTEQEKIFWDEYYIKLEYDYLYKIDEETPQINNSKVFKRTRKK